MLRPHRSFVLDIGRPFQYLVLPGGLQDNLQRRYRNNRRIFLGYSGLNPRRERTLDHRPRGVFLPVVYLPSEPRCFDSRHCRLSSE